MIYLVIIIIINVFLGYETETKKSKCECDIKNEISIYNYVIDIDELRKKLSVVSNINMDRVKCY